MISKTKHAEAELVVLAQRIQLETLFGTFQSLEQLLEDIEREFAYQSAEKDRIDQSIGQLYAAFGLNRSGNRSLDSSDAQSSSTSPGRTESCQSDSAIRKAEGLDALELGQDWDTYVENVERYIANREIKVTRNPVVQLLPRHRAAEFVHDFNAKYVPPAWDSWDYSVIGLAVFIGAVTDYLLVATPGGSFKGQLQRGSPLTAWMKEQSKKLSPMSGNDGIDRNAFQAWIAKLTAAAEDWAKVPYDVVSPKLGLTPNVHRMASLGHDPILGLVFGVGDILSRTCTFIDKKGAWRVINHPSLEGESNPLTALVKVIVHGFSDVFSPRGLPPPFLAPFQLLNSNSGFSLTQGGPTVSISDLARYMYANGYDLRHFMTTTISPAIAEIVLAIYHSLRACTDRAESIKTTVSEKMKREQMLGLTHGLLAATNVLKVALYGWNPMAINYAQFLALATRLLSIIKLSAERNRRIEKELDSRWQTLLAEVKSMPGTTP